MSNYVSGPYAGQMLVDLGAEVIKVEAPPDGDQFRHFGRPETPISPLFANSNRGKRSVMLNLKEPESVDRLLRLVSTADIWISNWRSGVADRLGLGDEVLESTNDRLIRLYITGYGTDGPEANNPVFDLIVQATSGLTYASSSSDIPRVMPGFPVDKIAAMMAVQAVLASLYSRSQSGRGDRIDLSMLAAASYVQFVEFFANRTFIDSAPDDPVNRHTVSSRVLPAKDGWLAVAPVSGQAIKGACQAVGHPEWVDELRSAKGQTEVQSRFFEKLETVLPDQTACHWLRIFAEYDVPVALCLTMDDHLDSPQVVSQEIYRTTTWDGIGEVRTVRYPAEYASVGRIGSVSAPPEVGEDNDDLLS